MAIHTVKDQEAVELEGLVEMAVAINNIGPLRNYFDSEEEYEAALAKARKSAPKLNMQFREPIPFEEGDELKRYGI